MNDQKVRYFVGEILECNGDFEYKSKYLFSTATNPNEYTNKVAMEWRGGTEDEWDKDEGGYWSDHTLIFDHGHKEVSKEEFDVLQNHLAVIRRMK